VARPTKILIDGIRNAFDVRKLPYDFYFLGEAEADWKCNRTEIMAAKSYFVRDPAPFGGSYILAGGIIDVIRTIADLDFSDPDFQYIAKEKFNLDTNFLGWLAMRKKLQVKVYAPNEGSIFFPNEPIVSVVGPLPDVRIVEGILTYALNFSSLALTKWYRLIRAIRPGQGLDFSLRRAQHSRRTTLAAMEAGCTSTSNCDFAEFFDVKVVGTMGHEWNMSFGDVREGFRSWLVAEPGRPVGLVDTLQCLENDFPIWLEEVYKQRDAIMAANAPIWGWRNDSGDLSYLTIEQYRMFKAHPLATIDWFVEKMRIVLTNELDEYAASSILSQIQEWGGPAGFDIEDIKKRIIWAAGTRPGVCQDQPSLGGVAKLMEVNGQASLKPSLDSNGAPGFKTSIPGLNFSALIKDRAGNIKCLLIYPARRWEIGEDGLFKSLADGNPIETFMACHKDSATSRMEISDYIAVPKQKLVYDTIDGDGIVDPRVLTETIDSVAARVQSEVDQLHFTMTRLVDPYRVKVSVTEDLFRLRQEMIQNRELLHMSR
jgi:nicotinate phosphoribosyltransferase